MPTLILYATKYGATREIAQRLAAKMNDVLVHDLKQRKAPSIAEFDCVILGSSLYVGSIAKEAREFIAKNKDILTHKRLGLFVSGLHPDEEGTVLRNNFPPELIQAAKATRFLGGIFDPKKAGFMERLAMKAIAKTTQYTSTLDERQIEEFADMMKL